MPDVIYARMTAATGGKPYCSLKRTYNIEKFYSLNVSGIDPSQVSHVFTPANANPNFACNILGIVASVSEFNRNFNVVIRITMKFYAELAGRIYLAES